MGLLREAGSPKAKRKPVESACALSKVNGRLPSRSLVSRTTAGAVTFGKLSRRKLNARSVSAQRRTSDSASNQKGVNSGIGPATAARTTTPKVAHSRVFEGTKDMAPSGEPQPFRECA